VRKDEVASRGRAAERVGVAVEEEGGRIAVH
jgi:hypothetical protein